MMADLIYEKTLLL